MARPTIDHLLDSEILIWRPTITDDSTGAEERSYVPFITVGAFIRSPGLPLADIGSGLAPSGNIRWYGRPDIDVRKRDICEVVSGPETGKTFEVNGEPFRPKNHHTQIDCIEWNGVLPDES